MSEITNPHIPDGIYPTNDTLITMTVDTKLIMAATTQEGVIKSCTFTDNQGDPESKEGPDFISIAIAGNFITWVGAVADVIHNPYDQVLIYDISNNVAITKKDPSSGYGRTHYDATAINRPISAQDYSIKFWVWDNDTKQGKGFQIDPKLQINS